MAKRFTETSKWNKPFIRGLEAPYKLLWFYILDDCDHAGIWQVDEQVANIRIGIEIDFKIAIQKFKGHIQIFDDGQKWFIPDFIEFQYGVLNPDNRVHNSILQILKKYKIKPLTSPLQGAIDKDKDKDLDKDKDKEGENQIFKQTIKEFKDMRVKIKKPMTDRAVELMLMELETLAPNNEPLKIEILNQSIKNSWQGVFPLKTNQQNTILLQPQKLRDVNIDEIDYSK